MKFVNPYFLNLLWTLIPVLGIICYGMHIRSKIIKAFVNAQMLPQMAPGYHPKKRWFKAFLILAAAGLAIAALAGPQAGFRWEKIQQKGVDIMIALDCSKSMLAGDIKPSRLARAKREIIDLLRMMKSDRAGLVAFSGSAILQCPLTLDHDAFHIFLDVLAPGYLPVSGTDINAAIEACAQGFEKDTDTQKAIILITDGEDTSVQSQDMAEKMAQQGIKIFCVGVGSPDGAPIPDEGGGFKKDESGNIVLSRVDEKGLQKIAALTDGAYVRSVAGDMDLDIIYRTHILGKMEKSTLTTDRKKVWENRFQWFLFPAVLLLFIEMLLSSSKKKKAGWSMMILACVFAFHMAVPGQACARMVSTSVKQGLKAFETGQYEKAKKHFIDAQLAQPDNEALYYNIGAAAYMNNEFEQARKNFGTAVKSKDTELRHKAMYNLANTEYKIGNLSAAQKGYENVLKDFPQDSQAKENLEFVKKKIEQQEQEQQQQKDQSKKDQQEDKEKDKNKDKDKDKDGKQENQSESGDGSAKNQNSGEKENQKQKADDKNNASPGTKKDREKQNSENNGSQPQPKASDLNKKEQGADQEKKNAGDNKTAAAGQPGDLSKNGADNGIEQMLNRLEDKPGKAMVPVIKNKQIQKDW